jgi:hypothetical protein
MIGAQLWGSSAEKCNDDRGVARSFASMNGAMMEFSTKAANQSRQKKHQGTTEIHSGSLHYKTCQGILYY